MKGRSNPIAKAMRSPHLKPKVIKSKKIYDRKSRPDGNQGGSFVSYGRRLTRLRYPALHPWQRASQSPPQALWMIVDASSS